MLVSGVDALIFLVWFLVSVVFVSCCDFHVICNVGILLFGVVWACRCSLSASVCLAFVFFVFVLGECCPASVRLPFLWSTPFLYQD